MENTTYEFREYWRKAEEISPSQGQVVIVRCATGYISTGSYENGKYVRKSNGGSVMSELLYVKYWIPFPVTTKARAEACGIDDAAINANYDALANANATLHETIYKMQEKIDAQQSFINDLRAKNMGVVSLPKILKKVFKYFDAQKKQIEAYEAKLTQYCDKLGIDRDGKLKNDEED